MLGVLTGLQAYNYVALTVGAQAAVQSAPRPQPDLLVVVGAARPGRALDGAPLPVRAAHVAARGVVSRPGAVVVFTLLHVALATSARGVILTQLTDRPFDWWMYFRERFFLNFDWEMMTYWALVAFVQRARLPARIAGARADRRAAADAAGRGAARGAAASAAPALPVQHAQHHLGADAPRRPRRRRDARAAQRSAAADAGSHRHAAGAAQGRSRLPQEVPGDRADAIR